MHSYASSRCRDKHTARAVSCPPSVNRPVRRAALGKKNTKILKPGESHTVEPMSLHSFFNPTQKEIKFNVKLTPGHTGFEYSLRILYGLAADGLTNKKSIPKSLKHAAIIVCMSDMNVPGLLTLLFPLLERMARKAKINGEEQKLIAKYCN